MSLVELLVALVLTAIVMSAATSSLLKQQQTHQSIRVITGADRQLAASMLLLGAQLSALDGAAGDIITGEARDTSLQFRAAVGASISCAAPRGFAMLFPDTGALAASGFASAPIPSDTLWWLGDSTWVGAEISDVGTAAPGCGAARSPKLTLSSPDSVPADSPLRITRQTRYALYKSGDGSWQLGVREWNPTTASFASPQPAVGPILNKLGARRTQFRYFDAAGVELIAGAGGADVSRIARVRFTAHSRLTGVQLGIDSVRSDSIDAAIRRRVAP